MALGFKMGASGKGENDNIKTYFLRKTTTNSTSSPEDITITLDLPDGIDTSNKIVAQVSVVGHTSWSKGYYISTGFLSYNIDLENRKINVIAHKMATANTHTTTIQTFITLYEIKKYKNSWHRAGTRKKSESSSPYSPVYNSLTVNITDLNKVLITFNYTESNGSAYYPYELRNNRLIFYYLQGDSDGFDKYGYQIDVVEYE